MITTMRPAARGKMLKATNIPDTAAWNTWSKHPAEMIYLPLGVHVTLVLYSDSQQKAILPKPIAQMRLGRHDLDGKVVEFETSFGGTELNFRYSTNGKGVLNGHWSLKKRGEWGIRYWIVFCLSTETGAQFSYDAKTGKATSDIDGRSVTFQPTRAPILVTGHDSIDGLCEQMDTNGYFDLSDRATTAQTLALRFDLEMSPQGSFTTIVRDNHGSPDIPGLSDNENPSEGLPLHAALQTGLHEGSLDAVRDVIGWNTLYDPVNERPYTTASRLWDMGTFSVWYNDQLFAGLMAGVFDSEQGYANLVVALGNATEYGNFACLYSSRDHWVDRSQAPHGAFITWMMYQRSNDKKFLELAYMPLANNHHWWWENRDPGRTGLVSCGTSEVGDAMYQGTAFAARNETGMDNSATHEEAEFDPGTRTLSTWDLGLNCALALDAEALSLIAAELGQNEEAAVFAALCSDSKAKIGHELWDNTRGIFANRHRNGDFVRSLAPTSFYPLLCGAASVEQAEVLLGHLSDSTKFRSPFSVPNAARDEPAYKENIYWRGRVWANVNFMIWQGLRRYGFESDATKLAKDSVSLFNQSWVADRLCGENYNAETGEITDRSETDPFYTWGAMLPLLGVLEVMDFSPWNGWCLTNHGTELSLGPMFSPVGPVTVTVVNGTLTLKTNAEDIFITNYIGKMKNIKIQANSLAIQFATACDSHSQFRLGRDLKKRIIIVHLNGQEIACPKGDETMPIILPEIQADATLYFELGGSH
jgi:putative isomerase